MKNRPSAADVYEALMLNDLPKVTNDQIEKMKSDADDYIMKIEADKILADKHRILWNNKQKLIDYDYVVDMDDDETISFFNFIGIHKDEWEKFYAEQRKE